jgi:hypothetical protein
MPEKRARFSQSVRSNDAIVVRGNQSPRRGGDGRNYAGHHKRIWVKRSEPNPKQISDDLDAARAMKVGEPKSAEGVISSPKTTDVDKGSCGSVQDKDTGTNILGASSNVFASMKSGSAVVTRGCSSEIQ